MKCYKCKENMVFKKDLSFQKYHLDGWVCRCGEQYYDPEQAQAILLLNQKTQKNL